MNQLTGFKKTANSLSSFPSTTALDFIDKDHNDIPGPDIELLPGIKWGNFCQLYTPAFWKYLYICQSPFEKGNVHRLGDNIIEEIIACLLGGYGIPSEVGILAFRRLKEMSLIFPGVSLAEIEKALASPFLLENGNQIKYRFYNQKSKYIHRFLSREDLQIINTNSDISFRNWLLSIDGIGPKTASWITRNWLQSENVAILDIHLIRAGQIAGIFNKNNVPFKNYYELERSYLSFCTAMDVLPSNMDAIIWSYMKKTNKLALKIISSQN